jgi:proteasome assembly chaperone (PAC2) family protein
MIPEKISKKLKNPVFIEGLPGLGNVGKIVVDLLIDQLKAKRILSFPVEPKPGLVLVQPNNMIRFPMMHLFHATHKKQDFLFLAGEAQPSKEEHAFDLSARLAKTLEELNCKEILTIGGIGLREASQEPKVYVTGNNKALIDELKKIGAEGKIHGVVGPIIGVTGILLGISKGRIPAAALLAESVAHPMYLGLRGAEQVLKLLEKRYKIKPDYEVLQASIEAVERSGNAPAGELPKGEETNYIG